MEPLNKDSVIYPIKTALSIKSGFVLTRKGIKQNSIKNTVPGLCVPIGKAGFKSLPNFDLTGMSLNNRLLEGNVSSGSDCKGLKKSKDSSEARSSPNSQRASELQPEVLRPGSQAVCYLYKLFGPGLKFPGGPYLFPGFCPGAGSNSDPVKHYLSLGSAQCLEHRLPAKLPSYGPDISVAPTGWG